MIKLQNEEFKYRCRELDKNFIIHESNSQVNERNEMLECNSELEVYWKELLKYIDIRIQEQDPLYTENN